MVPLVYLIYLLKLCEKKKNVFWVYISFKQKPDSSLLRQVELIALVQRASVYYQSEKR